MLRIGDFSKLSRISIRMLRHYDEIVKMPSAENVVDVVPSRHAETVIFISKRHKIKRNILSVNLNI